MIPSKAARALRQLLKPVPPPMTQETLAEALGVTQQAVSAWLRGVTKPSPERIAKIEALLGVPSDDWLVVPEVPSPLESSVDVTCADESGSHDIAASKPTGT